MTSSMSSTIGPTPPRNSPICSLCTLPRWTTIGDATFIRKILPHRTALVVGGYDNVIRLDLAIEQHDRNNLHIGVDSTLFTPGRHRRFDLPRQRAVSHLEMPYLFA